jgi:hypothetical protein
MPSGAAWGLPYPRNSITMLESAWARPDLFQVSRSGFISDGLVERIEYDLTFLPFIVFCQAWEEAGRPFV